MDPFVESYLSRCKPQKGEPIIIQAFEAVAAGERNPVLQAQLKRWIRNRSVDMVLIEKILKSK